MSLPALDAEGRLPVGRHTASVDELRQRFVTEAPNRQHRELIFRGFELYRDLLFRIGGPAPLWVDGGFVTHKAEEPADVDLVYLTQNAGHMRSILESDGIYQLLTLQATWSMQPAVWIDRLQPVGGLVDAFLTSPERQFYWHSLWQNVKGRPDLMKGYVEVMP